MTKKTKIGSCQSLYWAGYTFEPMNVEVDISRGLFYFNIVGLADKSMLESKFRILSALKNSEFELPQKKNEKVTVSLLPSDKKKSGTYADLAIAYSYLQGSGQIPHIKKDIQICCIGELRLEGSVMVKQDIIHMLYAGIKAGLKKFIIPTNSTAHFNLVPGIEVAEIEKLSDLKNPLKFVSSNSLAGSTNTENSKSIKSRVKLEEKDDQVVYKIDSLHGLEHQKRALMIGLCGNHHMLFSGLPGCGKSALADCAEELIDLLTGSEAIETYSIHQTIKVSGNIQVYDLSYTRPFRKPHSSILTSGLIGDGNLKPGEISLAHNGILVLNELCEFKKESIECLRDPMEHQRLLVHKRGAGNSFKVFTTIIATTNLCPCGKIPASQFTDDNLASDPDNRNMLCKCGVFQTERYQYKISEPILDRFPIICTFTYKNRGATSGIKGCDIKKIISKTREISRKRNSSIYNQYLTIDQIESFGITKSGLENIKKLETSFKLSKRKIGHVIRVARTIADISNSKNIEDKHVLEAAGYVKTKPFDI